MTVRSPLTNRPIRGRPPCEGETNLTLAFGVSHHQESANSEADAHKPILQHRVIRVINPNLEGIREDRYGLFERDAVLAQVALRLPPVPAELHDAPRYASALTAVLLRD